MASWAAVLGLGLVGGLLWAVSSPPASSSKGGGGASTKYHHFEVVRNVNDSPVRALKDYVKGDIVTVKLRDNDLGIVFPAAGKVEKVGADGLDVVLVDFDMKGLPWTSEGAIPIDITKHYAVYPRDVVSFIPVSSIVPGGISYTPGAGLSPKIPGFSSGSGSGSGSSSGAPSAPTTYLHVLSSSDVVQGPAAFASRAGFSSVDDFLSLNPGFHSEPAPGAQFNAYPVKIKDSPTVYRKVVPWSPGPVVVTRVKLPEPVKASEFIRDFGSGIVDFGDSGWRYL